MGKLNPKQVLFAAEYLKDLNATQAAIRAGYSAKTARQQGARLLSHAAIQAELQAGIQRRQARTEISADYVLEGLKEVVQRCMVRQPVMMKDGADWVQKTDLETGEGVWEFNATGATRSLELLGKHLGLFTEKLQVTSDVKLDTTTISDEDWAKLSLLAHGSLVSSAR